jgi:hypothetical protein
MGEEFKALDKLVKSKQMIVFFIFMSIISILFHPLLKLRQRKALELEESIRAFNRSKLKSFGGTSLKKVD